MNKKREWHIVLRKIRKSIVIGGRSDPEGKEDPSTRFRRGNGTLGSRQRPDSDKDKDKLRTVPQRPEED
jgi:hypothetical protein